MLFIFPESETVLLFQVIDLEQGVLMNQDGRVLQDSQGKPKRVVLGEDGRTIFGEVFHSVCVFVYKHTIQFKGIFILHRYVKLQSYRNIIGHVSRVKEDGVKNETDDNYCVGFFVVCFLSVKHYNLQTLWEVPC